MLQVGILGPLEVIVDDRAVALGGVKQRAVLAVLALQANQPVSAERVAVALWGEDTPPSAVKTVQVYMARLRKLLDAPDRLLTSPAGYCLRVHTGELDAERFDRKLAEGRKAFADGRADDAAAGLREALGLWRGPPLLELASVPFAPLEIARLEEARMSCLEARIDADLGVGRHAELVAELDVLVAGHRGRERLTGQLMLALYRSGRQSEALQTYRTTRRHLVDELGVEPGPDLRALEIALLNQDPGLAWRPAHAAAPADGTGDPVVEHRDRQPALEPALPEQASSHDFVPAGGTTGETAGLTGGAMIGREAELQTLRAGLDASLAGRGRLFLVAGEPGIGKSRLADELMREASARGARVLAGRCWEGGGAPTYWPWVQSLRGYVRTAAPEVLRAQLGAGAVDLAQILPELRESLPELPEPPSRDSDAAQFRLFDAAVEFLRNASASQPIVLFLDDLHAADAPSLLLLRFLGRELSSTRVLALGAFRDVDPLPGPSLMAMIDDVAREPGTTRLPLSRLSEAQVMEYVDRTAPAIASPELGSALFRQTEGNPLFVGESVRLLSVEGVQTDAAGALPLVIPESVREVIARRLTHLSDACNRVLLLASVLGREFELSALASVNGVSVDELLDRLDEAITARVVSDIPGVGDRLRFSHVLIRETIYDGITTARRVRMHRLVAEALENLYDETLEGHQQETPQRVVTLAHHWLEADEPARAIACYRRGAELAMQVFANYEAAEALTRAVGVLRQGSETSRRHEEELELTMMLGAVRGWGSPDYERARDLCVRLGRAVSPPILRGMAMNSIMRLELANAREAGVALVAAGTRDADPVVTVEGEYVLGVTSFWEGAFAEARGHLQQALERYSARHRATHVSLYSQDPQVVCLSRLAWTLWFLGHSDQAAETRDRALSLAEEVRHPFSRCYATLYGAIVSLELDDDPLYDQLLESAEAQAQEGRFDVFAAWIAVLRDWSGARGGDRLALERLPATIRNIEQTRGAPLTPYFLGLLAQVWLEADEPRRGLDAVTSALRDTQRTGAHYMDSELHRLRAAMLMRSGAPPAAIEEAFGQAADIASRQEAKPLQLRVSGELARWRPTTR